MDSVVSTFFVLFVIVLYVGWVLLGAGRGTGRRRGGYWPPPRDVSDVDEQLSFVTAVEFERQPLLNKGEFRVLLVLEGVVRELRSGHRVMAQTSLGEVLRPKRTGNAVDADLAFRSINSKRSDFIVVDRRGLAVLAVEYQGGGHYQGTAVKRDAVKRAAFESAGVTFIEVPAQFDAALLTGQVRGLLSVAEEMDE